MPTFPESAEVLEMKGARPLKGKRYVSEMDKNARPGKLLTGAGRTMKFDYDGELSFLIFSLFALDHFLFPVPYATNH